MTITDEMRLVQGLSTWGLASVQPTRFALNGSDDEDETTVNVDDVTDLEDAA